MMFWCFVTGFIFLLWLFLAGQRGNRDVIRNAKSEDELADYKMQLAELQFDEETGSISPEQAEFAKQELGLKLLETSAPAGSGEKIESVSSKRDSVVLFSTLIVLPVLSVLLYYNLGQPELATGTSASEEVRLTDSEELPSIEDVTLALEQRLNEVPEDETALWMLTRTYISLQRNEDALKTIEKLYGLAGDRAEVLLQYANVIALNHDGRFSDQARQLIERVLVLEPDNMSALWFAGLAEQQKGNYEESLQHWYRLKPMVKEDKQASDQLEKMLAMVEAIVAAESSQAKPTRGIEEISVAVSLSEELQARVKPDDSVFILARANDGLPMPVAVEFIEVKDLPFTAVLNDEKAMLPSRKLSSFDEVSVLARISMSGQPIASSGDLSSGEKVVKTENDKIIELSINQIVP